ncbi:MAG: AraC family transcriptional regulator [Ruminococcaceae bacterium]|nr:AraC family transcriptional regulator [Oscillospiraceae bacterium]
MEYFSTKMTHSLLLPAIISIHYFEYTADFKYEGESHDFWELIMCDKGELYITAGDREMILQKGQAYIHPPMQFHNVRANGSDAANSVILSFESPNEELFAIADRVLETDSYVTTALFSVLREARVSFNNKLGLLRFSSLVRTEEPKPFASEQIIQNYAELLLIHLIRCAKSEEEAVQLPSNVKRSELAEKIANYMDENLSEKMTFIDISKQFSISATSLKKLFGDTYGHGVMEHLTYLRVERAKQLLREGKSSCTEIATLCGFCSVHHFSNTFKKRENMSPTEYVKTIKSMLEMA